MTSGHELLALLRRGWGWCAGLIALGLVTGCDGVGGGAPAGPSTLQVRITPELQYVVAQYADITAQTGVAVTFSTTLSDAETDAHWGVGIGKKPAGAGLAAVRLFPAPIVLGVKAATARALGWCAPTWSGRTPAFGRTTWAELGRRTAAGDLRFALHHPAYSEVGAATVYALHFAADPVPPLPTTPLARAVAQGQRLLYPSYTDVREQYLRQEGQVDALFAPPGVIAVLNADLRLQAPLCPVWLMDATPQPGYTLALFNRLKRREYAAVAAYLAQQSQAQDLVGALPQPAPEWRLSQPLRVMVRTYLEHHLPSATLVIALDTSRTFARGLRFAKEALLAWLAHGEEQQRFSRLRHGEHLVFVPFDQAVRPGFATTLNRAQTDFLADVRRALQHLAVSGGSGPGAAERTVLAHLEALVPALQAQPAGTRLNLLVVTDAATARQWVGTGRGTAFTTAFVLGIDPAREEVCIGSLTDPGPGLKCQPAQALGSLLIALRGHQ